MILCINLYAAARLACLNLHCNVFLESFALELSARGLVVPSYDLPKSGPWLRVQTSLIKRRDVP